jgi:hypothetical protein
VGCFGVLDGVFALGVQQHFVETLQDGVRMQKLAAFGLDRLLETGLLSRMILLSHGNLLVVGVFRRSAVLISPSDAATPSREIVPHCLPPVHISRTISQTALRSV